jgi:hypothetical protein
MRRYLVRSLSCLGALSLTLRDLAVLVVMITATLVPIVSIATVFHYTHYTYAFRLVVSANC